MAAKCPQQWEYKDHPRVNAILPKRCDTALVLLKKGVIDAHQLASDCRKVHGEMFKGLTPDPFDYYAGHYRGEPFRCITKLNVEVRADPRVGAPAEIVGSEMVAYRAGFKLGLTALDEMITKPDNVVSAGTKVAYVVAFAADLLVHFLTIHPYVNGNGHIGRFVVYSVLGRYGRWPTSWPLNGHPPYDSMLSKYRDGDRDPLRRYIFSCL